MWWQMRRAGPSVGNLTQLLRQPFFEMGVDN